MQADKILAAAAALRELTVEEIDLTVQMAYGELAARLAGATVAEPKQKRKRRQRIALAPGAVEQPPAE